MSSGKQIVTTVNPIIFRTEPLSYNVNNSVNIRVGAFWRDERDERDERDTWYSYLYEFWCNHHVLFSKVHGFQNHELWKREHGDCTKTHGDMNTTYPAHPAHPAKTPQLYWSNFSLLFFSVESCTVRHRKIAQKLTDIWKVRIQRDRWGHRGICNSVSFGAITVFSFPKASWLWKLWLWKRCRPFVIRSNHLGQKHEYWIFITRWVFVQSPWSPYQASWFSKLWRSVKRSLWLHKNSLSYENSAFYFCPKWLALFVISQITLKPQNTVLPSPWQLPLRPISQLFSVQLSVRYPLFPPLECSVQV